MKIMILLLAGLAALAIVIALFLFAGGKDVAETGTPATARILSLRDTGGRLNSNPAIEFQLEIQPAIGPAYTATTNAIISTVYLPRFQPGASIAVRVDPADPSKVAIVMP